MGACSRPPANTSDSQPSKAEPGRRIASVDVVHASPDPISIAPGNTAEVQVRLKIDSGYHVNANPPSFPYLKPTELEVSPGDGLSVTAVTYPQPLVKKFAFSEGPLAVYEGDTLIKIKVKADRAATSGSKNLSGTLRVQACDDQVCYAPGSKGVVIPVNVQ